MRRAREAILARGGAVHSNVFTRVLLSLYGILDWRSVPEMPVEIMLLPRWFPFHLSKVSYWARTVLVPLLVLQALRPRAKNPLGVKIDELFVEPPHSIGPAAKAPHQRWIWFVLFRCIDVMLRPAVRVFPEEPRGSGRSIEPSISLQSGSTARTASARFFQRWPMPTMMFDVLGDKGERRNRAQLDRQSCSLLARMRPTASRAFRQCGTQASRVTHCWRSVTTRHALRRSGDSTGYAHYRCLMLSGTGPTDVRTCAPGRLGISICQSALSRPRRYRRCCHGDGSCPPDGSRLAVRSGHSNERVEWIKGMQSRNGGWAAFDVDNML